MRASLRDRIDVGPVVARDRQVEGDRFFVERLVDGNVRITIDRNGASVRHVGAPSAVRQRIAHDVEARDRAAVEAASDSVMNPNGRAP